MARTELMLPAMFSDHMVLQQGQPIRVWGWATPGERVWVSFKDAEGQTFAGSNGQWQVDLPAMAADATGSRLLIVGSNSVELHNVVVGEVWLCSGQSNMEFPLWDAEGGREATAAAELPKLRLLTVKDTTASRHATDINSTGWEVCSPESASGFSAVGFYFGRRLHEMMPGVPIGLIQADWGGTPIEAWVSREALASSPEARPILERFNRNAARWEELFTRWQRQSQEQRQNKPELHADPGDRGFDKGYAAPLYDDSQWQDIETPGTFERTLGGVDGVVWYRKTLEIPRQWLGRRLRVSLGAVDDFDITYYNAQEIGRLTSRVPMWYARPRRYEVPAHLVRDTRVAIAVRVFDQNANGGIVGPRGQMVIEPLDPVDPGAPAWIPLSGTWKARVEVALNPNDLGSSEGGPPMPIGPGHPHQPGGLFSGMIAPLIPYPIAGVLWYQGEANTGRAEQYEALLPLLIRDWRERWGQPMPFYLVQLAGYQPYQPQPVDSTWAELRDAQLNTYKRIPGTALAVTIDVGDANDIHPTRKREVGSRLARWALSQLYDRREIVPSGPIYQHADFRNGSATIRFDLFGGELKVRGGGQPLGFTIAGNDRVFYPADAQIEGDSVIVWSSNVREPVAVRYAWQDNPTDANLVNAEGLPASPFRTDRWPGLTADKR